MSPGVTNSPYAIAAQNVRFEGKPTVAEPVTDR
jgi:hypothetical protein